MQPKNEKQVDQRKAKLFVVRKVSREENREVEREIREAIR